METFYNVYFLVLYLLFDPRKMSLTHFNLFCKWPVRKTGFLNKSFIHNNYKYIWINSYNFNRIDFNEWNTYKYDYYS